MADEPMTVDHETNGGEASVPTVNGVESKDDKVEVSLDAKYTVSDATVVDDKSEPQEMEEVSESTLRLNYDEASIGDQSKNNSRDDISTPPVDTEENGKEEKSEAAADIPETALDIPETPVTNKGRKRKVSSDDELDLTGFDTPTEPSPLIKYRVDKLEKDIREAETEKLRLRSSRPPPAKRPHLASPAHSIEIPSRPSSGLSLRSESELIGGNGSDLNSSAANSPNPFPKGRKSTVDLANPLFRAPLDVGWKRELVYRAVLDQHQRRQGDIYYYTPQGKKLRSTREVSEHISGSGLTIENFTFFKEPLGIDDPEKEIIRDAKMMRGSAVGSRTESPVPTPEKQGPTSLIREGKRTPKPKGPKGASPERGVPSSPKLNSHFKVKSLGSRLSNQTSPSSPASKTAAAKDTPKSAAKKVVAGAHTKKNSKAVVESPADKRKAKAAPVSPSKAATSPKPAILSKSSKVTKAAPNGTPAKRGRVSRSNTEEAKADATSPQSHEAALSSLMQCGMFVQIFGYLNKRELAAAARVCRAWRDVAYTPGLWRSVRMKNSQVTDWQGLAAALKRQGTRHIDLRKMLLPPDDVTQIWEQFIKHISTVDTLLRLEMCRCPAQVVERACAALPQLQSLWACSVRCNKLDPAPLAGLHNLTELRIKGMSGLFLTSDLKCLENLKNLKHLSLTSVRELEKHQCRALGSLVMLEQLELGDCTFSGEEGAALLAPLQRLTKLRLERSPSDGSSLLMGAVSRLPKLAALELINFDIKTGFEDALGQCSQLKRLLIIPMYISQSATTNRCVLEGVLRLSKTLTHLVWGVTIELLRVTELFIDQCDRPVEGSAPRPAKPPKKSNMGDCIPVLKPVPGMGMVGGGGPPEEPRSDQRGPAQVEILPLPALQRLLTSELPDTRLKILRIPFHATTRQALVDLD